MNKYSLDIIAAFLILGTIGIAPPSTQGPKSTPQTSETKKQPFSGLLVELGNSHDRFFTIEEGWKDGESMNKMEAQWIEVPPGNKSLDEEFQQLRQSVPYLTYEIDKSNPRIVHIIDARLPQQEEYAVESVLKSIDFAGTVNNLPTEIAKQGIRISSQTGFSIGGGEFPDRSTVVRITAEGLKVRDALSNFIPLDKRVRILWIARTKLAEGEVSYVHFPYPGKKL